MGIFSKAPAAKERAAFDTAEQRLQTVADKLGQVQRDLAQARAKLAGLRPSGDLDDIDAAAQRFAAEHGQLSARIAFMLAARERLAQELADARRAVIAAEIAVGEALKQHFRAAADERLKRLAAAVGDELEALAVELCRADGSPHCRITMDSVMGALADAIADSGKAARGFSVGLSYAEAQGKIPPAPRSAQLDGDHRSGRHLDRLTAPVDAAALRRNLQDLESYITDNRHTLLMLGRDGADSAKATELQKLIRDAEANRAELAQQLEQHEAAERLAA